MVNIKRNYVRNYLDFASRVIFEHYQAITISSTLISHPLVYVRVLELHKSRADCVDVTLLVGERDTPRPLGVLELWVSVDTRVAHTSV